VDIYYWENPFYLHRNNIYRVDWIVVRETGCMRQAAHACYLVCTKNKRRTRMNYRDHLMNGSPETTPQNDTVNPSQAEQR